MKIIYIIEIRLGGKGKWNSDHVAHRTLKDAKKAVSDSNDVKSFLNDYLEYRIRRARLEDVKDAILP